MTDKLKVGIVGVSGYGGGELARLLLAHPQVELTYVTSGTYAGKPLRAALPGAAPSDLVCEVFDPAACADKCDFVFLAGEAGLAMKVAPGLLEAGKKIVDLSADFRLKDPAVYQEWYKAEHTASYLLKEAAYGMPELGRKSIKEARLVANPGCHVTAAVLGLAPLLNAEIVEPKSLIVDSYSGVSGAGRSKFGLDYHFSEVNESMRPYGVGGVHRHTPEIEQALSWLGGADALVTLTPHLAPITRGILTTSYATRGYGQSAEAFSDLHSEYQRWYKDAPFVTILESGQFPATKHVYGTNFCHIGLAVDKRTNRVIVVSAIDNLVKGAAGQAIQNMNLMSGFDETAGLTMGAVWP
ncbi:MAG: N-acetyl-gamma-glutamyl-phosphate reductase [Armatimonadota bacterium]|nr:N-acetyl-gamma-glutamyl-phosphate reductase [Armatimonadota bacterium]